MLRPPPSSTLFPTRRSSDLGLARWLWRHITPPERTAVIGDGELAWAARRKLELFPDMHLELVEEASREPPRINNGSDRKSTRLNSSHLGISYAVFCLKKKQK